MTRHLFTFLGTFVAGALIALVARAAWYSPNAGHSGHTAGGGDYAPMVTNTTAGTATAAPDSAPHSGHAPAATPGASLSAPGSARATAAVSTVNSVCPICGMDVDSDLPTDRYQGKTIGFGCKVCPAKFKARPDKYGPAALRNEVVNG